jgi:hypothetical protein
MPTEFHFQTRDQVDTTPILLYINDQPSHVI